MEDLLQNLEKSCSIASENDLRDKRKVQFKYCGRTEDLARDQRRAQLLEHYKRKREDLLNEKRGLIDDEFNENEDWMDWQEANKRSFRKWNKSKCKNQLMLSEWLLDRPLDLESNWTCVLCPEGHRALVIAKKGSTRAYHKSGFLLAKFKSILPSGAPSNKRNKCDTIILDCIWKETTKQLFALDVLYWINQPLLNCDAQFRLYWLKSKLTEVNQQSEMDEEKNLYKVFLPPHCTLTTLPKELAEQDPSQVDGILFYHNSAPYISGQTPLVGWLKPFMLPERLCMDVPQGYLDQRPEGYQDLEQWVATVSHRHKRKPRGKNWRKKKLMEVDSPSEDHEASETPVCEMKDIRSHPLQLPPIDVA